MTTPPDTAPVRPTRRRILTGLALGAGAAVSVAAGPVSGVLPGIAGAAAASTPPGRLVVVFLRGGMDGMSVCVPYDEARYYDLRPDISIPPEAVLDLDGRFGFHPAMAPVHGLFQEGRLAVVDAVGNPAMNRSHFEAQAYWEQGTAGNSADGFGWLARHLESSTGSPGARFRAVGLGANTVRSLGGYPDALTVSGLHRFALGGVSRLAEGMDATFRHLYVGESASEATGTRALDAVAEISGLVTAEPGAVRPDTPAAAFSDARVLLGADLGIEVITVDIGGWDTHNDMGDHTGGEMNDLIGDLARVLADFQVGLDDDGHDDVTTVLMSEFGRRAAQNGSGGLDHGYGNIMMAMGAGIAGGQVLGSWPGLAPDDLVQGDLDATTDFRDVLAELVRERLGNPDLDTVFPDHTVTPVGLTV